MFLMENMFQKINRKEINNIVNDSSIEAIEMDSLPMYVLDTGIKEYDSAYGGLWHKELMMIAAPSGTGKTILALNIMHNILKRYDCVWVIYFGLGMKMKQLLTSFLCIKSGYDFEDISRGRLDGVSYSVLKSDAMKTTTWSFIHDNNPDFSLKGIIYRCRRYQSELQKQGSGLVRVILIDYLQLVDKSENSVNGESMDCNVVICRKLKELAESLDATVILLSSLPEVALKRNDRRSKENDIDQYYEKGVLENIDTLLLLHRRDHCDYDCWFAGKYQMEVRVVKNSIMKKRRKIFKLCVDTRNLRVTELEEEPKSITCIEGLPFVC